MTEDEKLHRKQLERAAELSRLNPDELTPIERQRLRLDLYEFHMSSWLGIEWMKDDRLADVKVDPELFADRDYSGAIPERYVKEMVEALRDTLTKFAEVKKFPLSIHTEPQKISFDVHLGDPSMRFHIHTTMVPGRDAAVVALLRHLESSGLGLDRIRICPREKCQNIFVLGSHARPDRVRYCSVRCSRLAAIKAYQQREANKKAKPKKKQKRRVKK